MHINTSKDLVLTLIEGATTSLGCYPKYWVTKDGSCLCYKCLAPHKALGGKALKVNQNAIDAIDNPNSDKSWEVVACDVNWEDPWMACDECNKRIPSAYAEDLHDLLDQLYKLDPCGWATLTDGTLNDLSYDEQVQVVEKAIQDIKAQ